MIDTHAHLYSFKDEGREIIKNMQKDCLEAIVCIGTTVEDSKKSVEIANNNENIYATVAIYPEFTDNVTDDDLNQLFELSKNQKVVAIGEIGLDYHSENYDKEKQKEALVKQLEIADKAGLPFCLHCRSAYQDLYDILSEHKDLIKHSGLMHCYSGGKNWYKKFLDLGLYLSFSGNITFKNSDRSFLKDIPLDKILVETDSPYLSPEPVRGTQNKPSNTKFVIQKIADEIGVDFETLEIITSKNAKTFYFRIKKEQ